MNENTNTELTPVPYNEQVSRAEIDMQIATAKKWPRDLAKVKAAIESGAILDADTAKACFYTLPRGGKVIQGPSVRLAEIACSAFKNLRVASRVVSVEAVGSNPHVVVQSTCHDLENNVLVGIEKRRRITHKKFKTEPDEDDINLACNACASIAFRDAVFKVVPMVLVKPAMQKAKLLAVGDIKSLVQRRADAFETFAKMGVSAARVLAAIDKPNLEAVGMDDIGDLIGIHNALRDKELTLEEAFPEPAAPAGPVKPMFDSAATPPTDDGDLGPQNAPTPPVEQPRRRGPGRPKQAEQAPAVPPAAPSEPSAAPGADATGQTPCEYLEKFMKLSGVTWNSFVVWLHKRGKIVSLATFGQWSEIPSEMATEILQDQAALSEFVAQHGKKA